MRTKQKPFCARISYFFPQWVAAQHGVCMLPVKSGFRTSPGLSFVPF